MTRTVHDGATLCSCQRCRVADPSRGRATIILPPTPPARPAPPATTPSRRARSARATPTADEDPTLTEAAIELACAILETIDDD